MASRSGSEEKKPRRQQTQTYESEGEESEEYQPRQNRRGQRQQRGGQGPLDNLALGNVQNTAGGLVNTATGALGNVAGNAVDNQQKGGKSDTLRLRLDLNLDVEITLKAKIHGDLELALLYRRPRSPDTRDHTEKDGIIDKEQGSQSDADDVSGQTDVQQRDTPDRPRSPAYVAPVPKIGSIPQVSPGIEISATDRPILPPLIGSLLVGKVVNEDGDIVDENSGQVLARTAGDLPSMVGRKISNARGDILGDNGELLGYVADIEWGLARPPPTASPRSLFDVMGRARSSLMVDHLGNILDPSGNIVGKFLDKNNPLHLKEKEEREARERMHEDEPEKPPQPPTHAPPQQQEAQSQSAPSEGQKRPRRTEEERRQNAEAWRKENPNESPSDIFLDVKSTREGIQLTIRIPTTFNGQQSTPHISFS
ncbi:hypothetical protein C8A03DRAFT_47848 [Achaetomium macrosporum]|uniref:Uncharacterized protein n=1 Tax=Achaetomium macrosporum TaxID=79813 RepID=A0AAN7HAC2_9PEZI|nr:hypothetical protein C8A03DRAFT_47848 [Achaetomium macrosporum]